MSKTPQNLPKRTRVLVKDILFQEKYRLTHTQVDIMAYIINALMWATKVGAFFPISNKKFHEDLPQISEKTLEESLRALKAMELIEVQMITVPKWNNAHVRGISILPKGLDYNASYYQAKEKEIIENLKEQVSTKDRKIEELRETLKNIKAVEVPENPEKINKLEEEKENKILEEAMDKDEGNTYDDLEFKELVETVIKEFGATSEPICDTVKGWEKETRFYINSYNKLTVLTRAGQMVQVKDPLEISKFWKYISKNRHQIGKVIDFTKELTLNELNKRYAQMDIVLNDLNDLKAKIYKIEKEKDGVKVSIKNSENGRIAMLSRNGEVIIFGLDECEKALLGLRR